jgi:hypothetical protein
MVDEPNREMRYTPGATSVTGVSIEVDIGFASGRR